METKLLSKMATIALITVILLAVLLLISGQVNSRSALQAEVLHEIAESSAGSQTLIGPVGVIRYHELVRQTEKDKATDRESVREEIVERTLVLPPESLDINGTARVEIRSRGLYHARLFHAALVLKGSVTLPVAAVGEGHRRILDAEALLVMAVSDPRGITNEPVVRINGQNQRFQTGTVGLNGRPGAHIVLGALDLSQAARYEFSFPLELMGTDRLAIAPVGMQTRVSLTSDWPSPSFQGRFLPTVRSVSANGFEATWQVSSLARSFDQTLKGSPTGADSEVMGVGFLEPINVYSLSLRASTYGILFIFLTFAAFFLTEILRRLRIHPLQYLFVGAALAIFFLLLLALSEHVPFLIAYLVSATACVGLLVAYLSGVLRDRGLGLKFGLGVGLLYSILYGVLISEDNALLMGTALLFVALGGTMLATRRIDWYHVVKPSENSGQEQGPQRSPT